MKYIRLLIVAMVLSLLSCNTFIIPAVDYIDKMPRETDVPGWSIYEQVQEVRTDQIDVYIKKLPSYYKIHDIKRVLRGGYQWINDTAIKLTMEVFLTGSPMESFGLFSRDRDKLDEVMVLDHERYISGATYHERTGRYYVVVTAGRPYESFEEHAAELSAALKKKIEETGTLPGYVSLFSKDDRDSGTINLTYFKEGIVELPGIERVFVRQGKDSSMKKIFSRRDTSYEAVKDFSSLLNIDGNPYVLTGAADMQTAFRKTDDNMYSYIGQYREWIFGALQVESLVDARRAAESLGSELKDFTGNN